MERSDRLAICEVLLSSVWSRLVGVGRPIGNIFEIAYLRAGVSPSPNPGTGRACRTARACGVNVPMEQFACCLSGKPDQITLPTHASMGLSVVIVVGEDESMGFIWCDVRLSTHILTSCHHATRPYYLDLRLPTSDLGLRFIIYHLLLIIQN
ncbi:uncharacterized protein BO96DRAFT_350337 [Aspergillus niger CBS 101883]|uniref:Uncharacterized protein n=2 Tax=Aspergillus niger TaxID=5061 RepID=A2Q7Y7_ASPNC|nr:uncharacterized protein BO96DRAFT_350337 [Aspergillus niger CBS 101883]XP_059603115.1 hypothetical protein An01g02400 [Aspergillus niger]PYH51403.1 hypothetical protein BO96DRAFT_350337 [Aspergillus niger CBS 101883]CAK43610.1 hypothetical protein An01g02400 [Aspergillus niger]